MAMADPEPEKEQELAKIPYYVALTTYFAYGLLFVYGHFRDFFRSLIRTEKSDKVVLLFFSPCFCLSAPPPPPGVLFLSALRLCEATIGRTVSNAKEKVGLP